MSDVLVKLKVDYIIDYDQNSSLSNAKRFGNDMGDNVFIHCDSDTAPQKLFARIMPNTISTGSLIQVDEIAADISDRLEITPSKLVPRMPTVWFDENKPEAGQEDSFYVKFTNELLDPSPSVGILYNYIPPPTPITGSVDVMYSDTPEVSSSYPYRGHINYYDEYNYSIIFIPVDRLDRKFEGMSNGSTVNITSLNFQIRHTGTVSPLTESDISVYMASLPTTITKLPDEGSLRHDLTISTSGSDIDTLWDAEMGDTNQPSGTGLTSTFTQGGLENDHWEPSIVLTTPFQHIVGNNLVISITSNSGLTKSGSSLNGYWLGSNTVDTADNDHWIIGNRMSGAYDSYGIVPGNFNNSFRPNIRINWQK